jgi:3-deoxy-manno-octulosonate cytidylyltransferase (CMP-KDO synthetase)
MAPTGLPGKPLADICCLPMIVQVAMPAKHAQPGRTVVTVEHQAVCDLAHAAGFEQVMIQVDHQCGSDRIHKALSASDPDRQAVVIMNVQGDLPSIEPEIIRTALRPLENSEDDISTLTVEDEDEDEKLNPNVVKILGSRLSDTRLKALHFSRTTAPLGKGPLCRDVGLDAYRRAALEKFVALPPFALEKRDSLKMRGLEAGMRIDAEIVKSIPLRIDTPADIEGARHSSLFQEILNKRDETTACRVLERPLRLQKFTLSHPAIPEKSRFYVQQSFD